MNGLSHIAKSLPSSLEYLKVTLCTANAPVWLKCLLEHHGRFPNLRQLIVIFCLTEQLNLDHAELASIEAQYQTVGVQLSFDDLDRVARIIWSPNEKSE
jgi:hypothetical protein